jgi:hypothetical protein
VEANRYNQTQFNPIEVEALRIEGQSQPTWSTGVLKWKVE